MDVSQYFLGGVGRPRTAPHALSWALLGALTLTTPLAEKVGLTTLEIVIQEDV